MTHEEARTRADKIVSDSIASKDLVQETLAAALLEMDRKAPKFDSREQATVLAALRYWQRAVVGGRPTFNIAEWDIATGDNTLDPLTVEEIDEVCNRINR